MRAVLYQTPTVEHQNLVSINDCRKSVRHQDHRLAVHQPGQRLHQKRLVFRIGKGGGLVQHENRPVLQDGARDGDALPLPS